MLTKYTYNKLCDSARLDFEISESAITIAIDRIETISSPATTDVWMKSELSESEELILDDLLDDHVNTPLPDNRVMNVSIKEDDVTPRDTDGAPLQRSKITKSGWHLCYNSLEITTSSLTGIINKKVDGTTEYNFSTIKLYDNNGTEITQAENVGNCVKTVVDWEPTFDYEIIGGIVYQPVDLNYNCRVGIVGVPDVPEGSGGSKPFMSGLNLKYVPKGTFKIDGKTPKFLAYNNTSHTNKLRFIFSHEAGLQHTIMVVLNLFKA